MVNKTTDSLIPIPQSVIGTSLVLTVVFLVAGTYANVRVSLLFGRRRDLRKVPHFLLANLSAIGLLSSLLVMPVFVSMATRYIMKQQDPVDLKPLCKIRLVMSFFCNAVNSMTLSLLAMDRQDCIFRPFYRRLHSGNIKRVLLAVWCAATIIYVVFAILLTVEDSQCPQSDPFNLMSSFSNSSFFFSAYIAVVGSVFNVAAILIIVITFLRIVKRLRSSSLPHSRSLYQRYESQITKITFKTCAIFILSWFPVIISSLVARFLTAGSESLRSLKLITITFTGFTYVANPLLHYKMLKTAFPITKIRVMVKIQSSCKDKENGRGAEPSDHHSGEMTTKLWELLCFFMTGQRIDKKKKWKKMFTFRFSSTRKIKQQQQQQHVIP